MTTIEAITWSAIALLVTIASVFGFVRQVRKHAADPIDEFLKEQDDECAQRRRF